MADARDSWGDYVNWDEVVEHYQMVEGWKKERGSLEKKKEVAVCDIPKPKCGG